MFVRSTLTLVATLLACGTALAGPLNLTRTAPAPQPAAQPVASPNLGGGFLEMLFGGPARVFAPPVQPAYANQPGDPS